MLGFMLGWTAITSAFDGLMLYDAAKRLQSLTFKPIPCVILQSEVVVHSDPEGGSSYRPVVRYSYQVLGLRFEGDKLYAGNRSSFGSRRAHRIANTYPAGKEATAFVKSKRPSEAVLVQGFQGDELFGALFMTPFNLIMGGLWAAYIHGRRASKHPPIAGGVTLLREGQTIRARLVNFPAGVVALLALGIAASVAIFPVAFTTGSHAPPQVIIPVWGVVLAIAAGTYVRRKRIENSGGADLVLDSANRQLTLPLNCGRKAPVQLPWEAVTDITVNEVWPANRDSDSSADYYPTLMLTGDRAECLVKWTDREQAEQFVAWLREQLGAGSVPPRLTP